MSDDTCKTTSAAEVPSAAAAAWPCRRCGACCRVRGDVRLTPDDLDALAGALGLRVADVTARYTRLTADRRGLSLVEQPDGDCVFLDADASCRVQNVKPRQCREFPLTWRYEGYERVCPVARDGAEGGTTARHAPGQK